MISALLLTHILGAVVGLISGYLAMVLRKGSSMHGAAGTVFFVSMLVMSSTAAVIATFFRPNAVNQTVGLLTMYLVTTAWWAARHRDARTGTFDRIALLFVVVVAARGLFFGLQAASSPEGTKDQMPAAIYFIFGSIAAVCAVTDFRVFRRGGVTGKYRIARHLWRMCLALLITVLSLYPGNAKLFPIWLRETKLLFVPHLFLIGSMIIYRLRYRSRQRKQKAVEPVAWQPQATLVQDPVAQ